MQNIDNMHIRLINWTDHPIFLEHLGNTHKIYPSGNVLRVVYDEEDRDDMLGFPLRKLKIRDIALFNAYWDRIDLPPEKEGFYYIVSARAYIATTQRLGRTDLVCPDTSSVLAHWDGEKPNKRFYVPGYCIYQ
jgi:hypothetical protein